MNNRAPQKRRLETRAKLLDVARAIVAAEGYSALRVEDVVKQAGVAKGTLFSHFKDKDGLLAVLIGEELTNLVNQFESQKPPQDIDQFIQMLDPLLEYMLQDVMILDIMMRFSAMSNASRDEVIAQLFTKQAQLFYIWLSALQDAGKLRNDQPITLLAEGIQAFLTDVVGTWFCCDLSTAPNPKERFSQYIKAWLRV